MREPFTITNEKTLMEYAGKIKVDHEKFYFFSDTFHIRKGNGV